MNQDQAFSKILFIRLNTALRPVKSGHDMADCLAIARGSSDVLRFGRGIVRCIGNNARALSLQRPRVVTDPVSPGTVLRHEVLATDVRAMLLVVVYARLTGEFGVCRSGSGDLDAGSTDIRGSRFIFHNVEGFVREQFVRVYIQYRQRTGRVPHRRYILEPPRRATVVGDTD